MSRDLNDLMPDVEAKVRAMLAACKARGVDVLVYCTHRSAAEQAKLYAEGRTVEGTNWKGEKGFGAGFYSTMAGPWESWHQYRRAIDGVPMRGGKPLWKYDPNASEWKAYIEEGQKAGLEWAGLWKRFKEQVHFQSLDGLTMEQAKAAMVAAGFVPV